MTTHRPVRPIPITTGGVVDLRDIVGREAATDQVVALLAHDSVLLTGDRRIGKTSLSRLVEAQLRTNGVRVARVSAERTSMIDFHAALAGELRHTVAGRLRDELDHWSLTLRAGPVEAERAPHVPAVDELVRLALGSDDQPPLTLIIDEVPVLARAMEDRQPGSGSDLLIMLRRVRQESGQRLAMLLMGSMGFHHVAADAPGAVNDVTKEEVGPISTEDAAYLARCLMLGAGVEPSDDQLVAEAIAGGVDCVPYYVQHVVKDCNDRRHGRIITPAMIEELIEAALTEGDDRWNLRHYRDRIPHYYGADQAELVGSILDTYATSTGPLDIDSCLHQLVRAVTPMPSRSVLVDLVEKLEQDHYLIPRGRLSEFRSGLLRRAWQEMRR
jgi:hypothetical protein